MRNLKNQLLTQIESIQLFDLGNLTTTPHARKNHQIDSIVYCVDKLKLPKIFLNKTRIVCHGQSWRQNNSPMKNNFYVYEEIRDLLSAVFAAVCVFEISSEHEMIIGTKFSHCVELRGWKIQKLRGIFEIPSLLCFVFKNYWFQLEIKEIIGKIRRLERKISLKMLKNFQFLDFVMKFFRWVMKFRHLYFDNL